MPRLVFITVYSIGTSLSKCRPSRFNETHSVGINVSGMLGPNDDINTCILAVEVVLLETRNTLLILGI